MGQTHQTRLARDIYFIKLGAVTCKLGAKLFLVSVWQVLIKPIMIKINGMTDTDYKCRITEDDQTYHVLTGKAVFHQTVPKFLQS